MLRAPAGGPTVQLSSDTTFLETASDLTTTGLSPTKLPSPPPDHCLQMPVTSPGTSDPLAINQGFLATSLGFINLLEHLTDFREHFTYHVTSLL